MGPIHPVGAGRDGVELAAGQVQGGYEQDSEQQVGAHVVNYISMFANSFSDTTVNADSTRSSPSGPPRKIGIFLQFLEFSGTRKKLAQMAPNGARMIFSY